VSQTVLRGGFGVFYDLASSEAGNLVAFFHYPFGTSKTLFGTAIGGTATFPFSSADAAPPAITAANVISGGIFGFDPNLKLPYTLQWNLALERGLGEKQTLTASYIGSTGRRLIQTFNAFSRSPNFATANLVTNAATSDYHALQLQFQRRLSQGLQALTFYTWSHSTDDASAGSIIGNNSNAFLPGVTNSNRGPSDFDIRNAFSAGLTYQIPAPKTRALTDVVLRGWSIESFITARSAPPVTVYDGAFFSLQNDTARVRPDVKPGVPFYLFGSQCLQAPPAGFGQPCPGGKGFNPNAFTPPPTDAKGNPIRQGDLGRNALRAFGATQWDFAVHRDFPIRESLKLQFRAEMFNSLNHPNFAPPVSNTVGSQFGRSTQMLGQYLGGSNVGGGGLSPLYQIGGSRSVQLALKLQF